MYSDLSGCIFSAGIEGHMENTLKAKSAAHGLQSRNMRETKEINFVLVGQKKILSVPYIAGA